MILYSVVLFVHLASVLGLFGTLSFEALSVSGLRQASDLSEVRRRIDPAPGLPLVAMASILIVFFSGIFLTVRMSAFDTAEGHDRGTPANRATRRCDRQTYAYYPA